MNITDGPLAVSTATLRSITAYHRRTYRPPANTDWPSDEGAVIPAGVLPPADEWTDADRELWENVDPSARRYAALQIAGFHSDRKRRERARRNECHRREGRRR